MEAGNVNATTEPYKILMARKNVKPRRIKAESMQEKSFDDDGDLIQKCIRSSKNEISEHISGKYEQMAKFNEASPRIENQQAKDVTDCSKMDVGPRYLVEKPTPLAIDPNALVGDEEDIYEPVVKDEQEPTKRRRANLGNPVQESRICEQEIYAHLEAKVKQLKEENFMSHNNMKELSESCMQLRRENYHLLEKLKKVCTPDMIAYLEARNPDKDAVNPGSPE